MSFYDEFEIEEFENTSEDIRKNIENKKLTRTELENIKVGDVVYINFIPDSQKYIYLLTPKLGKVTKIQNRKMLNCYEEEENVTFVTIHNYKNEEEDLLHPGVSYMGHSLGYDYSLYLVE